MANKAHRGSAILDWPPSAELTQTLERIQRLCERGEGWNGYDVAAPNPASIANALRWVESFQSEVSEAGLSWMRPHVSSDEDGNVALEWRGDLRSLTVYVMPDGTEAIKAWGADMNAEMADSRVDTAVERL